MTINNSFFSLLRDTAFGKVVASLTIAAILLPLYPSAAGASGPPPGHGPGSGAPGLEKAPGQALSKSIREVNGVLENADRAMKHGQTIAAEMQALAKLRKEIEMLDAEVRAEFDEVGAWIHQRQLPETIIERHDQAVAFYQDEIGMLLDDLALLEAASAEEEIATTVERVHERLSRQQHETSPHPFDPAQLPHAAQRPRPDNVPRGGRDEFLGAGLVDNPLPQLAALPGYRFDALPGADDPAYLAETIEAQLSPKIRAKAESLGYDPVMIYHWVRNQVDWLPTWGAVQDADLTLSARRGNAMDISSLLISLLRASGIPSRYVHGTIEVPEAEFRNWIGGFKHIEEAMNFASSGGIPITGLITGGKMSHIRMEHIWVEAAVDFLPSRGAVMLSADTWLALDASYKQYEFFPGVDVAGLFGSTGEEIVDSFLSSGFFGFAGSSVQGLNTSILNDAYERVLERTISHVAGLHEPLVRDVLGSGSAVVSDSEVLPSGLPYQAAVPAVRYAALPKILQTKVAFEFHGSAPNRTEGPLEFTWTQLNNNRITISFEPATGDDRDVLQSIIQGGDAFNTFELPNSIPAYLVEVVPSLKIEGHVVKSGPALPLGSRMMMSYAVFHPTHGAQHYTKAITAGSFLSVGVIGGAVPSDRVSDLASDLGFTVDLMSDWKPGSLSGLTREELMGDIFHAAILSYFGQYEKAGYLLAQNQESFFHMTTSLGTFGYVPTVSYFFGLPYTLAQGGLLFDLDRVGVLTSTDKNANLAWSELNLQLGALASGMEHGIPEQLFLGRGSFGAGVSTVSVIEKAIEEGQTLYYITSKNRDEIIHFLRHHQSILAEVESALAIGRSVIIHSEAVTFSRWSGAGYLIYDEVTGAGAWRIGGIANGGFLGELEEAFSSPMFHLSSGQSAAYLLTRIYPEIGVYRTAIKDAGNVLLGVGAFMTVVEVRNETGSNWKGFAAGGADLGITFLGGVAAKGIFGVSAVTNPVGAAIVVSLSVGFLVSSTRTEVIEYIKRFDSGEGGGL